MAEVIPVNAAILKWARETSGLSLAAVSRRMEKPVETIREWEQGLSTPTYPQIEKLAYNLYRRPAAVFFFPDIPQESSPRTEFRTLPGEVVDTMPPEIIKVYKRAKVYQINLKELDAGHGASGHGLLSGSKMTTPASIVNLAKEVRSFLAIDLQTQASWRDFNTAIEEWRKVLTSRGIYVFKDAFRNNTYSGLSLYDKEYPVIVINNSMTKSRQVFTIFHELGHLLLNAGGIDLLEESSVNRPRDEYHNIEQRCNEFAGEFLLPRALFQSVKLPFNESNVSYLSGHFKVSREVVLRKYLTEGSISQKTYKTLAAKWLAEYHKSREKDPEKKGGGDPYRAKIVYLGRHYIDLAFSHYYQGRIDTETLAAYLDIKAGSIPAFETYVLGPG